MATLTRTETELNGNQMDTAIPISNRLRMDMLSSTSVNSVLDLPIEQIKMLQDDIDATADTVKNAKAWLQNYLDVRFGASAISKRSSAGKDSGIQRLDVDGFQVVADLKPKVAWDQVKLKESIEVVKSWNHDVADYVKTEFSVSETKYKAWPKQVREVFDPARTVTTPKQSYEIVLKK